MLAARLRAATAERHREVEHSDAIARLLRGTLDRHDYCRLLRNLHPIYAALESRLQAAPGLPEGLRDARLARLAALEADLETLHGPDWQALPVTDAARAYQAHLQALDAPLLGAHAYVRYLGDLAGGQRLGRIVEQAYGAGVAFHRFPAPGAAVLASRFRAALDALGEQESTSCAVIDEACAGFARHAALFAALQPLRS
ncbi:MAG: biliverdin-producing heme oxygenase [Xanthomonadaceae bacterium]|nr:biliverdin-producing heme oxygenase [Xanthomonadaceae bacterium]